MRFAAFIGTSAAASVPAQRRTGYEMDDSCISLCSVFADVNRWARERKEIVFFLNNERYIGVRVSKMIRARIILVLRATRTIKKLSC